MEGRDAYMHHGPLGIKYWDTIEDEMSFSPRQSMSAWRSSVTKSMQTNVAQFMPSDEGSKRWVEIHGQVKVVDIIANSG